MSNGQLLTAEVRDLSIEAYHAEREWDSSSMLRMAEDSPGRYRLYKQWQWSKEPTDSQKLGTLAHVVLLERSRVDELVAVIPADVLASNGARSTVAFKDWSFQNATRLQVKEAEFNEAVDLADEVLENPAARDLIERASIFEQSIFWTNGDGHQLKCRIDCGSELDAEIVDVKTCRHGPREFHRAVDDYGYEAQAALYTDGYAALYQVRPIFRWLVVPTERPYSDCFVTKPIPAALLERGRARNAATLAKIREYQQRTSWIKEGHEVEMDLEWPPYMLSPPPGESEARHEY